MRAYTATQSNAFWELRSEIVIVKYHLSKALLLDHVSKQIDTHIESLSQVGIALRYDIHVYGRQTS